MEFAITAPVFFLFLLAAFEFGWLNVHAPHGRQRGLRSGPRGDGARRDGGRSDGQGQRALLNIVGARGATVTITPATLTTSTDEVTVAIDVPMNKNGLIVPRFTSKTTLHSESTLRTERAE